MSANSRTPGITAKPTAPPSAPSSSGRRLTPDCSTPSFHLAMVAARSSSEEAAVWRSSAISSSPMMTRAHWMTAMPISRTARPAVVPRPTFRALACSQPKSMYMVFGTTK